MNKRVKRKFIALGIKIHYKIFNLFRVISSLIIFVLLLFLSEYGYIVAPLFTIIYYIALEYVLLDINLKKRIVELENDAIDFIPLFLLSLRNCKNVKKSLEMTVDIVDNSLSKEFLKVLKESELGKSLEESLINMRKKIPSIYLDNIIMAIIETNRVGNDISLEVNMQLDNINNKYNKKKIFIYKIVPLEIGIISIIVVFLILMFLIMLSKYL